MSIRRHCPQELFQLVNQVSKDDYEGVSAIIFVILHRYWEGSDVCIMLEDIDFVCEVIRILMEACTDNGK